MINRIMSLDSPDFPDMYSFAGYPYKEKKRPLLINIDGYEWCVFGDRGLNDIVDDPLFFGKLSIFGFPLTEESQYLGFT